MNRNTILPITLWVLVIACLLWAVKTHAEPVYAAQADNGGGIILYSEPCELKAVVANLPRRAVWLEDGKATEGCYGAHPDFPVVVMYFADGTVVVVHRQLFQKMTGA